MALDLLTLHLQGAGFEVVSARDGAAGIALIRRLSPDAVVLDIRLPGLDGWEVLDRLAADPDTAATPVVVVSVVDERQRGMASGAVAYLVKPVSRDDLLGALAGAGVTVGVGGRYEPGTGARGGGQRAQPQAGAYGPGARRVRRR